MDPYLESYLIKYVWWIMNFIQRLKLMCLLCMSAIDRPYLSSLEANFELVSLNENLLNAFFKNIQLIIIELVTGSRQFHNEYYVGLYLQITRVPGGHLVGL